MNSCVGGGGGGGDCGERDARREVSGENNIVGKGIQGGGRGEGRRLLKGVRVGGKLQALVYDLPESGARSVEEGAGKRCSECGGRCRKAVLGVWRKVPESGARGVEEGAGKRCSECG